MLESKLYRPKICSETGYFSLFLDKPMLYAVISIIFSYFLTNGGPITVEPIFKHIIYPQNSTAHFFQFQTDIIIIGPTITLKYPPRKLDRVVLAYPAETSSTTKSKVFLFIGT